MRCVACGEISAHRRDDEAEHRRLRQPKHNVLHLYELEGVAQIGDAVEAQTVHRDQIPAHYADDVRDQHQHRYRQHRREYARGDQKLERVGRQRRHRVDLFGDAHGAYFSGDARTDTAREH
jgi:hypothetical protein